jgi:ATP-binding cassette subfamily C protein CydC
MPLAAAGAGARAARLKQYALDAARVRLIDLDRGRAELGAGGGMAAAQAGVVAAFARAAAAERQLARLDAAIRVVSGLGQQAATVAAVALGAPLQGAGLLSATGFAAVVLSSLALGEAVAPLRVLAMEYGRWTLAARRIVALERDGIAQMERVPAPPGWTIALAGISVRAEGALRDRLTGITLEVGRGARIALAGPSGGGKSSVIGVLAGLLPPTSGRVAGAPSVAWLGQRTELFRGTVADNLRLGRPEADAAALRAALEAVALGHVALDLHLGDGGAGLSGGERRRLALARTLLMEADLTLLDEPTEGLDAITAGVVFEAILARTAGRALVFATHREAEAAHADTVIVLRDGQIVRDQAGSGAPMRR